MLNFWSRQAQTIVIVRPVAHAANAVKEIPTSVRTMLGGLGLKSESVWIIDEAWVWELVCG